MIEYTLVTELVDTVASDFTSARVKFVIVSID